LNDDGIAALGEPDFRLVHSVALHAVGSPYHEHRKFSFASGPVDVGGKFDAVPHGDGDAAVDANHFGDRLIVRRDAMRCKNEDGEQERQPKMLHKKPSW
jgi:hypothetical protein